jgi:predicted DNA-binding protein
MNPKNIDISVDLPVSLYEQLLRVASYEKKPQIYYIKKALQKYLEPKLEDIEDYEDAVKAWDEYEKSGKQGVCWEDIKKKING